MWSLQINGDEIVHTFVVQYTMLVFGNFPGNMLILEIDIFLKLFLVFVGNIHFYMDPYVDSML